MVLFSLDNKWIGKTGKVTWKRAGFNEDTVFAILNNYYISLKFYKYTADSVAFYYKNFFSKPLLGRLSEKVRADVKEENASLSTFQLL